MIKSGDIFTDAHGMLDEEAITILAATPGARIERILSTGQASPAGFWYDQDHIEWVILLAGSAGLRIEGEAAPRILRTGDYVEIPAHARHRVEWTEAGCPTIWLAVHLERNREAQPTQLDAREA